MTTFLALYRGDSVNSAKLLALSAQPEMVRDFAGRILRESEEPSADAVINELEHGRRRALQLVRNEAQ